MVSGLDADSEQDIKERGKYMKPNDMDEPQVKNVSLGSPIGFLLREKYENMVTDSFLDLMVSFIKDFLGESDASDYDSEDSLSSNSSKMNSELSKSP